MSKKQRAKVVVDREYLRLLEEAYGQLSDVFQVEGQAFVDVKHFKVVDKICKRMANLRRRLVGDLAEPFKEPKA